MSVVEHHSDDDDAAADDVDKLSFTFRELPDYLPCRCNIDGGRTQINVRPLRRDEVADFYVTMKEAATSGSGYGYDELPGLAYFVRWYVHDLYNAVFELTADKEAPTSAANIIIGYTNFGPSVYTRSRKQPALFDGNIVLRPELRGRGWIRDLNAIRTGIVVDLGIHCFFEDAAIVNVPATRSLRRTGATVCGTIPRYVYIRDFGYVDGVLYYKPLDQSHSFKLNNVAVPSNIGD